MKTVLGKWIAVAALVGGISANAVYNPSWERPLLKAKLTETTVISTFPGYPIPESLTLNKHDGARDFTSLTLQEDTGLRCIKAPCPSSVDTRFNVFEVSRTDSGLVIISAREVLPPTRPNQRLFAPRVIELFDYTKDKQSNVVRQSYWQVKLMSIGQTRTFVGEPEGVITIQ